MNARRAAREKAETEFRRIVDAIPAVEIIPDPSVIKPRPFMEDFSQIKFSNITAKTNREKLSDFVVVDVETTGLKTSSDEITNVAAIRFRGWQPVEKFVCLCSTKRSIPDEVIQLNGITNEMLEGSPRFGAIAGQLTEFIGTDNIVGHNLEFDLKFLLRGGVDFLAKSRKYYDTLTIAQHTLKKPKMKWDKELAFYDVDYEKDFDVLDHKLVSLCNYYGIVYLDAHRAENDALVTGLLLNCLADDKK